MAKYYVFPLQRTEILLSVKSAQNPRTGAANYLASLPNPIGGNDDGRTALQTCQAEAAEETRGKVVVNGITGPFYRGQHHGSLDFYVSTAFTYNSQVALGAAQQTAIDTANNEWHEGYFPLPCRGRCPQGQRVACLYCAYLDRNETGLTLLENTGEVVTLDLLAVDCDSDHEAADSIVANAEGAALAAVSADFIASHSVRAMRKLAAWVKYCEEVIDVKTEVARALAHANGRHAGPPAPVAGPRAAPFQILRAGMQQSAMAVNAYAPQACPTLASVTNDIVADTEDIIVCHGLLDAYRKGFAAAATPGVRATRSDFVNQLIVLIIRLRAAEALLA